MADFTLQLYKKLLDAFKKEGYAFITFREYMEKLRPPRFIILRHDVDLLPQNSLAFARIQHSMDIRGSYYFRAVPESWDESIIREIHSLGHEVGYHYEDVDLVKLEVEAKRRSRPCGAGSWKLEGRRRTQQYGNPAIQQSNHEAMKPWNHEAIKQVNDSTNQPINEPLIDTAILSFQNNLEKLRQLVPVSTICMHGSPRSKYDNRDLWKKYDYRDFGIIGEPYFDMDFDDVFYLTDTGRRWDGWKVSVRDKVPQQERWIEQGLVFGSTNDIIKKVESEKLKAKSEKLNPEHQTPKSLTPSKKRRARNREQETRNKEQQTDRHFPDRVMFTFHPQRWTGKPVPWLKEFIMQNLKNVVKGVMVKLNC